MIEKHTMLTNARGEGAGTAPSYRRRFEARKEAQRFRGVSDYCNVTSTTTLAGAHYEALRTCVVDWTARSARDATKLRLVERAQRDMRTKRPFDDSIRPSLSV